MTVTHKVIVFQITDHDKTFFTKECDIIDKEIDRLMYEFYRMSEEEVIMLNGCVR